MTKAGFLGLKVTSGFCGTRFGLSELPEFGSEMTELCIHVLRTLEVTEGTAE